MDEAIRRTEPATAGPGKHPHVHRLKAVADLVEIAGQMKSSTVVVAGGDRIEDLRLVESARDHGIVDRIILVGHKQNIDKSVRHLGIDIQHDDIIDAENDEGVASATVKRIQEGDIDILLKGNISTPVLNRHMLGIVTRPTVSLVTIFDAAPILEGKPIILTDAGFTTVCNFGRMVDMVNNAVEVARLVMNVPKPRVAILSANEKQIQSLPSTWMGAKLAERSWPDAIVYGPLSFDLATDPASVAVKGLPDLPGAREVAGQADILVCPGIDAANIIYKAITAMVKYGQASSASVTLGFSVPYIIISRADPLSVRLESIALCSIYSQQRALLKETPGGGGPSANAAPSPGVVLALAVDQEGVRVSAFADEGPVRSARIAAEGASSGRTWIESAKTLLFEVLDKWSDLVCRGVVAGVEAGSAGRAGGGAPLEDQVRSLDGAEAPTLGPAAELAAAAAGRLSVPSYISGISQNSLTRALAAKASISVGRPVEDMNLIIVRAGKQVAIRAMSRGKVVDTTHVDSTLYGIAKGVGAVFAALDCDVETIVLSGDLFEREDAGRDLRKRIGRLAPVMAVGGDPELERMAWRASEALEDRDRRNT
jgi:phosphotransacetylase